MRPASVSRRVTPVLALWLAAASCTGLEPSAPVDGAVPMAAPVEYASWYERTEACSQLRGALGQIEWYVVPGVATFETSIGEKVGLWERVGNVSRITIAGDYVANEMVVRHEMLHDLLERTGHPPEYFVTRCHLTWDSWDAGAQ
ncbi:MAG TPA: hypothetical protein VFV65_02835 [Gemmatimonadales bacterium]|nr:hypothetical protein [Gemmatimonadales bacterium]